MKKISIYLSAALLGIIALVSCNKDARIADNADLGVNFRVTSGALTKATPTTVANLGSFKVTAIGNGASYFTDLNVAVTSAGVCTPEKTYYWPGYELGFYAYANPSGGTASITNAAKGVAGVTPVAAAADQSDFVVAYSTGTKADNMASGVALNFRHALSQIKIKATNKSTAGLKINVKGVKVANVKASGDFSYPAAVTSGNNAATLDFTLWNSSSASKTAYTIGGTSETAVALSATASDIMFSGSSWMLVPQQLVAWNLASDKTNSNANAYIGVYLQILDANDGQLYPATAGQYAYANVPIDTKWEPGKTYTYTLNFLDESNGGGAGVDDNGDPVLGSPINFTLTVDDWAVSTESTSSSDMFDLKVESPVTPITFGGLQIAPGPLYYDGTSYAIYDDWNHDSYNSIYGKTANSTYFSFIEMGQLFEKADFSMSDGDITNELDPLDGWRLPTDDEWTTIVGIGTPRPGSKVNDITSCKYVHVEITNASHAGLSNTIGILLFPDNKTITGATLTDINQNKQTAAITNEELNNYLEQGCVFLPGSGYYNNNYNSWSIHLNGGYYLSSSEFDTNRYKATTISKNSITNNESMYKSFIYNTARLVRE